MLVTMRNDFYIVNGGGELKWIDTDPPGTIELSTIRHHDQTMTATNSGDPAEPNSRLRTLRVVLAEISTC